MSRLKNFTRALIAGYVLLGANIFYTLASVPLALHYLAKAEFGLWALVSQLGGYILLIDMGMSTSVSRILIDHKDERSNGFYGSVIQTGALVGLVQGGLILFIGVALSILAGSLLHVPDELRRDFIWLMFGQSALLAVNFAARIFNQLLFAHQRMDITSYGSTVFFFLNLVVMWAGFVGGMGVYSFLVGQAVMIAGNIAVTATGCVKLGLLPQKSEWGSVSRECFGELFAFGQGVFLISVGSQLISASQTILLTRLLGLETAATWSVCTRAYTMITQIVWRISDYAAPALSEMVVRKEKAKLLERFRNLAMLMTGLSLLCGTIFATSNGAFVQVWTAGKMSWPAFNNLLLGLYFFTICIMRVHNGLVGASKDLRFLRFIYLIEGSVFVGLNLILRRDESMTLMLILSLACALSFTLPYGLFRTREYFEMTWGQLFAWLAPAWHMGWRIIPVAMATWWVTRTLSAYWQLIAELIVPTSWGALVLLRHGLEPNLRIELIGKLPAKFQSLIRLIAGC